MTRITEIQAAIEARQAEIDSLVAADTITPEQDAKLTALVEEQRAAVAERNALEARSAAVAELRSAATFTPSVPTVIRKPEAPQDVRFLSAHEVRDHALRTLDDKVAAGHLSDSQTVKVDKLVRNLGDMHNRHMVATMRPEYRSAFAKYMAGRENTITVDEQRAVDEVRALSTTDANGGYAIPELLDPAVIIVNDGVVNPIRAISRVETGISDKWEGISSTGVTASWDAEGAEVSDDSPTLARPTVTAYKGQAFIPFSVEIGGDWQALAAEAVRMFADAKDRLEGAAFATGNGTSQPKGILTALDATTYAEVTPTTDGAFGAVDLFKVFNALPPRFRPNASFMMNLDVMNEIRTFSSSSNGTYYTVDLTQGYGFRVLGRPAYENSNFAEFTGTTGASNILVVGDFSNYLVYDRVGSTVEYIPHLFSTGSGRPTGQRGWVMWFRTGADMLTPAANPGFRVLQNQ